MNPKDTPDLKRIKHFPKYESDCHGAPVEVKNQKVKYWCSECGEPCIARKKK